MRIQIWSDLVCPWCYIGKRRFERALAQFGDTARVEVVHRAFQLNPSMPSGQTFNHREVLMTKYRLSQPEADAAVARVEQTAAGEGLEFHLAGGVTGNTAAAHQLVHLARDRGLQNAVLERLYRAHFTEQRSLFDADSLVALGAEAGLDPDDSRRALAENAYGSAVDADVTEARRLGITGVPFYAVDDKYGISGAQSTDVFVQTLTRASAERPDA